MGEKEKQTGNQINITGDNTQLSNIRQTFNQKADQKGATGSSTGIQKDVERLVSEDKLEEAINLLLTVNLENAQQKDICILLLRRLSELNISKITGDISKADYQVEKNQIANAILQILTL